MNILNHTLLTLTLLCLFIPSSLSGQNEKDGQPGTDASIVPGQEQELHPSGKDRFPLFAVKTNLLFDLATAVNVEVEVPIGKRFSVAGEWMFPDWVDRNTNRFCLQANIKSAEGRFWFGDRIGREKLTGHFIGAYGQWGDFDWQPFREDGFRCYNGWAAGLSYGFAHSISRRHSLRLEYGIGIGYAYGDYCRYYREADGTILATKEDWHYHTSLFPVPTKLKVSLVWMIYHRRNGK